MGQTASQTGNHSGQSNSSGEAIIASLWRYPVKGLGGQQLDCVKVEPDRCFPLDRAFAIENGRALFDKMNPKHLPKVNFLNLMRDERLALLSTEFDESTQTLTILRNDRQVAKGDLSTSIGRNMIEQFFAAFMSEELKGAPRILQSPDHHFTDMPEQLVHIISLSSLTSLEHIINQTIEPVRFRANIQLEGSAPWAERNWIGKHIKIGEVEIEIVSETGRCAAINVDPATATRGRSLAGALTQQFGNNNFGVYGRISKAGEIKSGASITIK